MIDNELKTIAKLSIDRIERQCSYVPVNKKALGSMSKASAIETLNVFVLPEIEEVSPLSYPGLTETLIEIIDSRIAELEREESFSLQTSDQKSKASFLPIDTPSIDVDKILRLMNLGGGRNDRVTLYPTRVKTA